MELFDIDMAERVLLCEAKISAWKFKGKKLFVARHMTYGDFSTVTVLWEDDEEKARQVLDSSEHVKGEYTLKEVT